MDHHVDLSFFIYFLAHGYAIIFIIIIVSFQRRKRKTCELSWAHLKRTLLNIWFELNSILCHLIFQNSILLNFLKTICMFTHCIHYVPRTNLEMFPRLPQMLLHSFKEYICGCLLRWWVCVFGCLCMNFDTVDENDVECLFYDLCIS